MSPNSLHNYAEPQLAQACTHACTYTPDADALLGLGLGVDSGVACGSWRQARTFRISAQHGRSLGLRVRQRKMRSFRDGGQDGGRCDGKPALQIQLLSLASSTLVLRTKGVLPLASSQRSTP